jgi:hypothetical protein
MSAQATVPRLSQLRARHTGADRPGGRGRRVRAGARGARCLSDRRRPLPAGLHPGRLARLFADSGTVAVVALPVASAEVRREARELHAAAGLPFVDLHVPDGETPERTAERALEALA